MIYLLSQMTLALAVAIVLGVAIGWLIHSATRRQHDRNLNTAFARRTAQLAQAQSDIAMLNDDYDEMHRKTQEQIDVLAEQNNQIPSLTSNLEKSQLLVRQMMQRHEAKVRDLTSENKRLASKLEEVEKQERNRSQLAEGLDNRRRQISLEHDKQTAEVARFAAAESTDDPFDEVMDLGSDLDLGDDLPVELDQTARQKDTSVPAPRKTDNLVADHQKTGGHEAVYINADVQEATHNDAGDHADNDLIDTLDSVQALDDFDGLDASLTQDTLEDEIDEADLSQAFEFGALDNDTFDISDGSGDIGTLFEPVSQQDDLQQIFGIGPLTEKALNELGITSYSQLADLKQHEIQRIADALQIGPGRIERDNWVGNARRQLEEVLEQL